MNWVQNYFKPVQREKELLDSYSAIVNGKGYNKLYFHITPTVNRYPQYRPVFAKFDGFILSLNNKDVFSGSLEECKADAERRSEMFLGMLNGEFTSELLRL